MFVEIKKFNPETRSEKLVARCVLDEKTNSVALEGDKIFVANLEKEGILVRNKQLFPKDGKEFLFGLQEVFDHPSLYAELKT